MGKNYVTYHLHDDTSLLDSCTKFKDYVDKAVELKQPAIAFTNHGNIYNWIDKKMYCDKNNIKYIHGCEVYLTRTHNTKIRDNYHTILLAKNHEGFLELNKLVDISTTESHTYYKPRISFDEFLSISDNVIKISSCLASPLARLEEDDEYYQKLLLKYDYYEIQYHNDSKKEQYNYNLKLYNFSKVYNKPLIAGTDTHSINSYKAECRTVLQKAKGIEFADEDTYDLTYKSYDEVYQLFLTQGALNDVVIKEALANTIRMAESVEHLELDTSYKYPKLSDDDDALFVERILNKAKEKIINGVIDKDPRYTVSINEEIRVFKKLGMTSFMLFMSELCTWCRETNIPFGFCRGSVGGSVIAYILDIIDVNPIEWKTVFSRFCNEDRIEIGDIDLDFSPSQREQVFEYIFNRFGLDKSAYILSLGTISDKGTIDEIGRGLNVPLSEVDDIKKLYDKNPEEARLKHSKFFYYFDGLLGTNISQSLHPAGIVASPVTLQDNYGTFWKDGKRILQVNMEEIHEVNLVKYDILGLKNVEIIKDTYELINQRYPLSHEINWNDENVWNDILCSPVGIFQFESPYSYQLLSKYKPRKVNDLSLVNASLRPSGASYRDRLIAREFNSNPSEQIDELLKDNNGFLVFQEDTIKFLTDVCGLSGSEADNVRRAIGRKQIDRLEKALPTILEGYCCKSNRARSVAEEEAKAFLKIIEDSSNYQFGYNHSTGYSMIGYLCAYLRYHYPLEFITAFLNNADGEEDIVNGTNLASIKNIKIMPPKFRYSKGKYTPNRANNTIYKGIGSIKYLNELIGEELYNLRDKKYENFIELLVDITENTSGNTRAIEILIKLNFFEEFGATGYLCAIYDKFKERYKKTHVEKTKIKRIQEITEYEKTLNNIELPVKKIVEAELEFVGYISYKDKTMPQNVCLVQKVNVNRWGTPFVTLYRLQDGAITSIKVNKSIFKEKEITPNDIIILADVELRYKKTKTEEGKFITTDESEYVLNKYSMLIEE